MASKSKKRRRVLGASCILAALIIAGSSFAWFTSKDEVTNRLTANADYGVSIVESFVPPKNMIPGQQVNKDVYAVNTGTVDAFVKETITGNLNYTYEKKVKVWDANCVELDENVVKSIDGATSQEGGGYLAWTSVAPGTNGYIAPGPINSATITDYNESQGETPVDNPGQVNTRWTPKADGIYIFRRSVSSVADTLNPGSNINTYKYAGYYFVKGDAEDGSKDKYYKIVIGNDTFRANDSSETDGTAHFEFDITVDQAKLGANVTVDNDTGIITGDVQTQFVTLVTKQNVTPTFTYHGATTDDPAYLLAYYTDGASAESAEYQNKQEALNQATTVATNAYNALLAAQKDSALKEAAYENALGDYNTSKSRYDQTYADWKYADAMKTATDILYEAARIRGAAQTAHDNANDAMNNALTAVKTEATVLGTAPSGSDETEIAASKAKNFGDLINGNGALNAETCNISSKTIFVDSGLDNIIDNGSNGVAINGNLLTRIKEYRTAMKDKWDKADSTDDIVGWTNAVQTALGEFASVSTDTAAQTALDHLNTAVTNLKRVLTEYQTLYAGLKTATVDEAHLTELDSGATLDIQAWIDRVTALQDAIVRTGTLTTKDSTDYTAGISPLVADYKTKYQTYQTEHNVNIPAADTAWENAITAYNTAVEKAQNDYLDAIHENQMSKDIVGNWSKNGYERLVTPTLAQYQAAVDSAATAVPEITRWLADDGTELIKAYSALKTEATPSPKIATGTDWQTIGKTDNTLGSVAANYNEDTNEYTKAVNNPVKNETEFVQVVTSPTGGSAQTLGDLKTALGDSTTGRYKIWKDAESAFSTAEETLKNAKATNTAAQSALESATTAANIAAAGDASAISFKIYLDDKNADLGWTSELADGESSTSAAFYYNKVLGGGQTSDKLIDAVELVNTVGSKDYKDLTFDLNVKLDSAQVTYADNQRDMTATAVEGDPTTFVKTVTNINQTTGAVEWGARATEEDPTYTIEGVSVTPAKINATNKTIGTVEYEYAITKDGATYWGTELTNGAEFKKVDLTDADNPTFATPAESIFLQVS